jgi:hypothetical protein
MPNQAGQIQDAPAARKEKDDERATHEGRKSDYRMPQSASRGKPPSHTSIPIWTRIWARMSARMAARSVPPSLDPSPGPLRRATGLF